MHTKLLITHCHYLFKVIFLALAGVAQWTKCRPAIQRDTCSIPHQGTCLGLQARSPVGGVREATTCLCFSSLSPSLPLCLKRNK